MVVVIGCFLLYNIVGDTPTIEAPTNTYVIDEVNEPDIGGASGQIGEAKLGPVEEARFEYLDEKTRLIERVIGFETLLHEEGDQWVIDKPYMNIFEKGFRCDVTADKGTIQVENAEGLKPSPRDALLAGNVTIHIIPEEGKSFQESFFLFLSLTGFG